MRPKNIDPGALRSVISGQIIRANLIRYFMLALLRLIQVRTSPEDLPIRNTEGLQWRKQIKSKALQQTLSHLIAP